MNSWLNDTMRPRHAGGEISAMYIGAVMNTAPTPKPLSSRATISVAKFSESAASSADTANTHVASRSTVRRPKRSASGPEMKMDTVEATAIDVTAQPSSNSFNANSVSMKPTAPVNSEPSKPMRKPLSATIRMVQIAPWRFAASRRPTDGVPLHEFGLEHLLHVELLLIVDVFENPA